MIRRRRGVAVAAAARLMLYLAVMAGCLVVTLPLELLLRARVYARWRRLLLTLVPVLVVFLSWDALAIHAHDWSYRRLTGAADRQPADRRARVLRCHPGVLDPDLGSGTPAAAGMARR